MIEALPRHFPSLTEGCGRLQRLDEGCRVGAQVQAFVSFVEECLEDRQAVRRRGHWMPMKSCSPAFGAFQVDVPVVGAQSFLVNLSHAGAGDSFGEDYLLG